MASHIFQTPAMNPVPFVEMDAVTNAAFYTKHLRQDWYALSYLWWNRKAPYYQKWRHGDTITFQINSNDLSGGSIVCQVIDCKAAVIATITQNGYLQAPGNEYNGLQLDTRQYRIPLVAGTYPTGRYYILITTVRDGETRRYISEPMDIAAEWPGTLLYRYKCPPEDPHDVWWVLNPNFQFRAEGEFRNHRSVYADSRFVDQIENPELLSATRIKECELFVGAKLPRQSEYGLPPVFLDIIEEILVCPVLNIDGRNFTRADNATLDRTQRTPTPLETGTVILQSRYANEDTTIGAADLQLFERPATFPYVIAIPSITDSASTLPLLPVGQSVIEIMGGAAETVFLAQLNAIGLGGIFSINNGYYIYTNGPGETYTGSTGVAMSKYVDLTITGGGVFAYIYNGEHIAIGANLAGQYLPNLGVTGNSFSLPSTSSVKIYHRDTLMELNFFSPVDVPVLSAFVGDLPTPMYFYQIQGHAIPTFDLAQILPTKNNLSQIIIRNSGLGSIGTSPYFVTIPPSLFANLSYIDLGYNELSSTQVDDILIDLEANTNYSGGGTIDLQFQTPAAPPTGASANAIASLQAAGWAVYTD